MGERTFDNSRLIRPIGFRDVDEAFFNWWNNKLNLWTMQQDGSRKKVPVKFIAPERWVVARDEGVRDETNGTLILPIVAVSRTAEGESREGSFQRTWADTKSPHVYSKRIDSKSSLVKELINEQRLNRVTELDPARPIYQIFTHKTPDHYVLEYKVIVWTTYIDEMNVFSQKIANEYDFLSVKSFSIETKDGYKFQAYQTEIESENNLDDYTEEERLVKEIYTFKVPIYLFGESDQRRDATRRYFSQTRLVISKEYVNSLRYTPSRGIITPASSGISDISIAGTVSVSGTLIATITGDGTVQWQRGDTLGGGGSYSNITNATGTMYTVEAADIDYSLRCISGSILSNVVIYDSVADLPNTAVFVSTIGLTLADGNTTVDQWQSSYGGVSVVVKAIAATNRPAYSLGGVGSRPLLTFDGADNCMTGGITIGATHGNTEYAVVGNRISFEALGDRWIGYGTGSSNYYGFQDRTVTGVYTNNDAGSLLASSTDPDANNQRWWAIRQEPGFSASLGYGDTIAAQSLGGMVSANNRADGGAISLGAALGATAAANIAVQAVDFGQHLSAQQRLNLRALLTNHTGIEC